MDAVAYQVLAATASARGDRAAAEAFARHLLDHARENREPQSLLSSLGECALLALEAGEPERSQSLVDELAAAYSAFKRVEVDVDQLSGFIAVAALGRGDELGAQLEKAAYDSPWVEACRHIAEGRLDESGDTLHAHEAHAYAAMVRLLAAERAGRETPGLREAIAFYERAGASSYLARAKRLQASASDVDAAAR